jgi:hypothetical protein
MCLAAHRIIIVVQGFEIMRAISRAVEFFAGPGLHWKVYCFSPARESDLDAVGSRMFRDLSNQAVMALLCIAIIVSSCIVIEGLYCLIETYAMSLPDPLLRRVGWKP